MFVWFALNPAVESPALVVPVLFFESIWRPMECDEINDFCANCPVYAEIARQCFVYNKYLNSGRLVLLVGVLFSYGSLKCMIQWHLFKDSVPCKNAIQNLAG